MKFGQFIPGLAAASLAVACITLSGPAFAEDEFDVQVKGGEVSVTPKGAWHINKDFPWKLTVGDQKLDKSKFALTDTSAKVSGAPKGAGTLKGGVCSGDKCKTIEKQVTIP
jgi:hypothetical protein